jgi:hypothetical protein
MTEHDDDDPARYFHIPYDPTRLPPHLEQQRLLIEQYGIWPEPPDWPGSPGRRR